MKKRRGQTKEPQLLRESLVGGIFLLAFFMIVTSEGVDFGVSQLDSLTQSDWLLLGGGNRSEIQSQELERRASLAHRSLTTSWVHHKKCSG